MILFANSTLFSWSAMNSNTNGLYHKQTRPWLSIDPPVVSEIQNEGQSVPVVLHNALAWSRQEVIRVSVKPRGLVLPFLRVTTSDGSPVPAQVHAVFTQSSAANAAAEVAFVAHLPPLAVSTYFVEVLASSLGSCRAEIIE